MEQAFAFMVSYHGEEVFPSGEKMIIHLLSVARTVLAWGGTARLASAALLHLISPARLAEAGFDQELVGLVSRKNRLEKYYLCPLAEFPPTEDKTRFTKTIERESRYIAKMTMIVESNPDIWLLEAADNFTTLKTIETTDTDTKTLALRSYYTLPIALRAFDLENVAMAVEDQALLRLDKEEYKRIEQIITDANKMDRKKALEFLKELTDMLSVTVKSFGIRFRVNIDVKSVVSTKRKLARGEELTDPARFRFIINGNREHCKDLAELVIQGMEECGYQVNWLESKNYLRGVNLGRGIDLGPKGNGYESLHLNFFGPSNDVLNVQIRTEEMHEHAEIGGASHSKSFKLGDLVNKATRAVSDDLHEQLILEGRRYGCFRGRLYRVIPYPARSVPTLLDLTFAAGAKHGLHCPETVTLTRIDQMTGEIRIIKKASVYSPLEQGDKIEFLPLPKPVFSNRRLNKAYSLPAIVALKLAQKGIIAEAACETRASEIKAQGEVVLNSILLEESSICRDRLLAILKGVGLHKPPINILYSQQRLAKLVGTETIPELMLALALTADRESLVGSIRQILRTSISAASYLAAEKHADLWLMVNNLPGVLGSLVHHLKQADLELVSLRSSALSGNSSLLQVRVAKRSGIEAGLLSLMKNLNDLYQGLKPQLDRVPHHRFQVGFAYSQLNLGLVDSFTALIGGLHGDIIAFDFPPVLGKRSSCSMTISAPEQVAGQFEVKLRGEFRKLKRVGNLEVRRS